MDRALNIINYCLIIIVSLLLLITFSVVMFGGVGMNWGSMSDITSAIGTIGGCIGAFGTLWVALAAYKKAPDWIKDKQNDAAFQHITTLMAEYDEVVLTIRRLEPKLLSVLTKNNENTKEYEALNNEIYVQAYRIIALQTKLESSKRWGIGHSESMEKAFSFLIEFYDTSFYLFGHIETGNMPKIVEFRDQLTNKRIQIDKDSKQFNKKIEQLFTFSTNQQSQN